MGQKNVTGKIRPVNKNSNYVNQNIKVLVDGNNSSSRTEIGIMLNNHFTARIINSNNSLVHQNEDYDVYVLVADNITEQEIDIYEGITNIRKAIAGVDKNKPFIIYFHDAKLQQIQQEFQKYKKKSVLNINDLIDKIKSEIKDQIINKPSKYIAELNIGTYYIKELGHGKYLLSVYENLSSSSYDDDDDDSRSKDRDTDDELILGKSSPIFFRTKSSKNIKFSL